jgi:ubiquinone/menaquinone biosynthesis C-methylase UbiE
VELRDLYAVRFSEPDLARKARIWEVLVRDVFQPWIGAGDTVLDLGSGHGEFLNHLHCGRRIGVDVNPDGRRHLAPGVEFHAGPVSDVSFLSDGSIDVVFTSNVMEHLPKHEVERMITECRRVLRRGGQLIAMGPNARLVPGAYWDFWDHQTPITDRSIRELLEAMGFTVTALWPRFLPYTTRSALPQSPALVRLYLKLPIVWRLLGGQFLVRARTRA